MKKNVNGVWLVITFLWLLTLITGCSDKENNLDSIEEIRANCSHEFAETSDCDSFKICKFCAYSEPIKPNHNYFGGICKKCNTKQGTWELRYKDDDFGRKTNEAYVHCEYIRDDDWDLEECYNELLTITIEEQMLLLRIYDTFSYGMGDYPEEKNISVSRWLDGDVFNISVLDEDGYEYHGKGWFSMTYDAVIPYDEGEVFGFLRSGKKINIHLQCEDAKKGYLFSFDSGNFAEVHEDYLTSLTTEENSSENTNTDNNSQNISWEDMCWNRYFCEENGTFIWWERSDGALIMNSETTGEIQAYYREYAVYSIISDNELCYRDNSLGNVRVIFNDSNTMTIKTENKDIIDGVYKREENY